MAPGYLSAISSLDSNKRQTGKKVSGSLLHYHDIALEGQCHRAPEWVSKAADMEVHLL